MEMNINIRLTELNKVELVNAFQKILINNQYNITEFNNNNKKDIFKCIKCIKDNINYSFYFNISNLNKAYLPKDPTVKRRQISSLNIDDIPTIKIDTISFLLAYCEIGEKAVFVAWNPFYFTEHKTNRSCYVNENDIIDAYSKNYVKNKYGKTPFFIFNESGFDSFIKEYIELYAV